MDIDSSPPPTEPPGPVKVYSTRSKKRLDYVESDNDTNDSSHSGSDSERSKEVDADPVPETEPEDGGDDDDDDWDEAEEEIQGQGDTSVSQANEKTTSKKQPPNKVDVMLPAPSPRRPSRRPGETPSRNKKSPAQTRAASHGRDTPNPSGLPADDKRSPPTSVKPLSAIGVNGLLAQTSRTGTPDSTADDHSVAGESLKGNIRTRKTEAERIEFLQSDPLSGEVEPHRVYCKACEEWVQLNSKRRYVMQHWILHRKQHHKQQDASERPEAEDTKSDAAEEERTRKDIIVDDVAAVEVDAVHDERPASERPSSHVATAQRKLSLVNDGQVKKISDQSVECAICHAEVSVRGEVDYDLTLWKEHKATCAPSTQHPAVAQSPGRDNIATLNLAQMTAETPAKATSPVVPVEAGPASSEPPSRTSRKRRREDDEEDQPQPLRRRPSLAQMLEVEDAKTFFDLLAHPFRSFMRGYREGRGLPPE